jgi:hypothetical protein
MQIIIDYKFLVSLWLIFILSIGIIVFINKKNKRNDVSDKEKRDTNIFKFAYLSIVFVTTIDSTFYIVPYIHNTMLNNAIEQYQKEGFYVINTDEEYSCHIPNSVIHLNSRGKETIEEQGEVTLCI